MGNITVAKGASTTTYTYDYRNRLTNVKAGGTMLATYVYDALDRRIGINDNTTQTWTVYNTGSTNPYADFNSSASMTQRYVFGPVVAQLPLLAHQDSSGNNDWYLGDQLGSVRYLFQMGSGPGTVLDHVIYDSYGQVTSETNAANGDRFKYAGQEYDSATSLYYAQARNYSPAIGRFTARDPLGFDAGDPNLYKYAGNQPTNNTDPSGTMISYDKFDPSNPKKYCSGNSLLPNPNCTLDGDHPPHMLEPPVTTPPVTTPRPYPAPVTNRPPLAPPPVLDQNPPIPPEPGLPQPDPVLQNTRLTGWLRFFWQVPPKITPPAPPKITPPPVTITPPAPPKITPPPVTITPPVTTPPATTWPWWLGGPIIWPIISSTLD